MRATHRGTRKNITQVSLHNDIVTYGVESYTNTDSYTTTIHVKTGEARCSCGRFDSRVKPAAKLMQTTPKIDTSFVCKHIEDCAIEAKKTGVIPTADSVGNLTMTIVKARKPSYPPVGKVSLAWENQLDNAIQRVKDKEESKAAKSVAGLQAALVQSASVNMDDVLIAVANGSSLTYLNK